MILAAALLLASGAPLLWRDPGAVESIDFVRPAGGAACPSPPFTFVEELFSGMSAKVLVRDARGVAWQVKGGPEARADAFSTRLVGALGYYAEAICFLAEGRIEGVRAPLRRASGFMQPGGGFTYAGFERRDPELRFREDLGWRWDRNPFQGTRELAGLRLLAVLLSNWDNKDARNRWQGSNTGVLESKDRWIYFVTDWGQTLGAWRGLLLGSPWNCTEFARQTAKFVQGVSNGRIRFGFRGQHTAGFSDNLTQGDMQWLMQWLGRITAAQIQAGLAASGATQDEQRCLAAALRSRIEQLRTAASSPGQAALR